MNQNRKKLFLVNNILNKYNNPTSGNTKNIKEDGYVTDPVEHMVISFLLLRRLIGTLGIALPIVLVLGSATQNAELLPSISHFYHSSMKIIFTGVLFTIAAFFWTSNGEIPLEKWLNKIAALSATLVALLPTKNQEKYFLKEGYNYTISDFNNFFCYSIRKPDSVGNVHLCCAAIFFICLISLIYFVFLPREKESIEPNRLKVKLYKISWIGMTISILLIMFLTSISVNSQKLPYTFILETIALLLFGMAWITKGHSHENSLKRDSKFYE